MIRTPLNAASLVFLALCATIGIAQNIQSQNRCDGDCRVKRPACELAWADYVSAVFLGTATEVRDIAPVASDITAKWEVTFKVREVFRGNPEQIVTVLTGGDNCGFPFSKGREYLVFANRRPDGHLYVSICAGSKFANEATDDLKYLRGLSNEPSGSTIFGTAFRYAKPLESDPRGWGVVRLMKPMVGQRVAIDGQAKRYEAMVDGAGHFKIAGLLPGRYAISVSTIGAADTTQSVVVADKGCAETDFRLEPPPASKTP
jgi:hypothetical protein